MSYTGVYDRAGPLDSNGEMREVRRRISMPSMSSKEQVETRGEDRIED